MKNYKIFASIVDDATLKQVEEAASCEAYKDCEIRIMPDCHAGSGCTIGSVIRYKDRVVPNTVGVDIGCGMLVVELGNVDIDLKKLDEVVNMNVPSGFNIHDRVTWEWESFEYLNCKQSIDKDYIFRSIGTLGGGNHFIELDVDDSGDKYLVVHSGSRNLGVRVCSYWHEKAVTKLKNKSGIRNELIARLKAEGRAQDINKELKKLVYPEVKKELAYVEDADLFGYLNDMHLCQEYAEMNRKVIVDEILGEMDLDIVSFFQSVHNYIDINNHIIRKGAISAAPHELLIIPMNMRDGSIIGKGKGNMDWLYSAPHGAGRIMSRAQAFKEINIEDFKRSMDGIYSTSVCEGTLDEAPMVYKPADIIRKDIEPTVEIVKVIKPLWNFKAKTSENPLAPFN